MSEQTQAELDHAFSEHMAAILRRAAVASWEKRKDEVAFCRDEWCKLFDVIVRECQFTDPRQQGERYR